ncbi:MAG: cysteine-rich CWC family protein [Colwellia sp.]
MMNKNDTSICPLCQKSNRCDVDALNASEGCWCMNTKVPQALLATLPAHLKKVSCICNACIERYHQQQVLSVNPEKSN